MAVAEDVTVIVPTYNRASYLGESLDSILAQTRPPRQIILLDDGSTDDTPAVAARFGDRIEYVRQENAGKSAALNHALQRATGASIWIVDDDDLVEPTALERLSAALAAAPQAGFAFGNYDHFIVEPWGEKRFYPAPMPPRFSVDDLHFGLLMWCFVYQPAMLVRRACYEAVGPFDVASLRAQDYEMLLRLSAKFEAVHVDSIVFHQRQHSGTRGPAAMQLAGADLLRRQEDFDGMALRRAAASASLADYLPRSERPLVGTPAGRAKALLRRSAFMARRRDWESAAADLEQAARLFRSMGDDPLVEDVGALYAPGLRRVRLEHYSAENPLLRTAASLPPSRLRRGVLTALLEPLSREGVKAALAGNWSLAARYMRVYVRLAGPATMFRHLRGFAISRLRRQVAPARPPGGWLAPA